MELPRVDQIVLDEVTTALLGDVDQTAHQVNELRPLAKQIVESVQRDILGERVYSSNAIEGNTFNLGETIETLRTGHIELSRKREATEVINLGKAIEHIQANLSDSTEPYCVAALLELHRLLLHGIKDEWAGRFRSQQVLIRGAKHQPPDDRFVSEMIEQFLERLRDARDVNGILLATWAHWTIARIHPFMDGNGRMARLWQDLVLFRSKLTCAIILPEVKTEYLASLAAADEGDFNPLTQLIARRVASTLDKYLSARQKVDATSQWARDLIGETSSRAAEKRKLAYLRWSRKMEELRYEFERCASTVTHASTEIEVQLHPFDIIDQGAWENIRSGARTSKTWFFNLSFQRDQRYLNYIFFFGRHYWSDLDTDRERSEPRVCLLISEQERGEMAYRLGELVSTPLSIREVFIMDKEFVRVRFDPDRKESAYDRSIDATTIAQEFIRDALLLRMT
ncbi:MAG TPA: Fic family protein [Pirellulales bacterium]|nr:Fic family protein [Pirellulales bacterium]